MSWSHSYAMLRDTTPMLNMDAVTGPGSGSGGIKNSNGIMPNKREGEKENELVAYLKAHNVLLSQKQFDALENELQFTIQHLQNIDVTHDFELFCDEIELIKIGPKIQLKTLILNLQKQYTNTKQKKKRRKKPNIKNAIAIHNKNKTKTKTKTNIINKSNRRSTATTMSMNLSNMFDSSTDSDNIQTDHDINGCELVMHTNKHRTNSNAQQMKPYAHLRSNSVPNLKIDSHSHTHGKSNNNNNNNNNINVNAINIGINSTSAATAKTKSQKHKVTVVKVQQISPKIQPTKAIKATNTNTHSHSHSVADARHSRRRRRHRVHHTYNNNNYHKQNNNVNKIRPQKLNTNTNTNNNNVVNEEDMVKITVAIIGDASVGKSCILTRFMDNNFDAYLPSTLGFDQRKKKIEILDTVIELRILDTCGQERFATIVNWYFRIAHVFLIVYDITSRQSFENIQSKWVHNVLERCPLSDFVVKFIVGTKLDLPEIERQIPREMGQTLANKYGCYFCEVSSKSGRNVQQLFLNVAAYTMNSQILTKSHLLFNDNNNDGSRGGGGGSGSGTRISLQDRDSNSLNNVYMLNRNNYNNQLVLLSQQSQQLMTGTSSKKQRARCNACSSDYSHK